MTCPKMLALMVMVIAAVDAKRLVFQNRGSQRLWIGSLGNDGKAPINNGGWQMDAGSEMSVDVDDSWAGRFWARTGCNFDGNGNGHCETGDCGNRLQCNGAGGAPPVSLAEFTFSGWGGNDYYDISLVDGSNVPCSITPTDQYGGGDEYRCTTAACNADINPQCPGELQQVEGGRVVGCKSACLAFNTDQYCCRGAHNTPETCKSSDWPQNYPAFFKGLCPLAYSYAYDDQKSTFTCANTGYRITFG